MEFIGLSIFPIRQRVGGNTFGLGALSLGRSKPASNTWRCFSHSQDSPVQAGRGRKKVVPVTLPPGELLGRALLSVPATSGSAV